MTDPHTKASNVKQPTKTSHASFPPSARGSTRPPRPSSPNDIGCTMGANGSLTSSYPGVAMPGVVKPDARFASSKASATLDPTYPVAMISEWMFFFWRRMIEDRVRLLGRAELSRLTMCLADVDGGHNDRWWRRLAKNRSSPSAFEQSNKVPYTSASGSDQNTY